jgi:polysaccharide biosynthesis protein PslG
VLEPQAAGTIDQHALAFTDRLVGDAAAAGIRVVATVAGTPCWASSAPQRLLTTCRPKEESAAGSWPPRVAADYAGVVAYLAGRYGTKLAAIEVWNEPDQANQFYFAGPHKAARYAAMLRAAYPAIKQASPALPVLAGSLVGSSGEFLRALYVAGIMGYYDGLSVHFYNLTLASLRSIHEVQFSFGDAKPLWLDEFGWSSCWPRHRIEQEQACVTAGVQAANLTAMFRALARTPYVAAALVYKLADSSVEEFGMLSVNGARKPAFGALARVLADPLAGLSRVTLNLRRGGRGVIASGSAPVGDFMELQAFKGSILRYNATFILDRFNHFRIPLPSVLGTHGLRVRVFQYSAGLSRNAQRSV